jgi:hypothetical protein
MVRVENKTPKKKRAGGRSKVSNQKKLTVVQCWLTQGQELDEEMQLMVWTEQPTDALVGAGSRGNWGRGGN